MKLYIFDTSTLEEGKLSILAGSCDDITRKRILPLKSEERIKEILIEDALIKYAVYSECRIKGAIKEYDGKGRPFLASIPLEISIAHSCGVLLLATGDKKIGVDIEKKRPLDFESLKERFFFKDEKKLFDACKTDKEREEKFFSVWTRKEAIFKQDNERYPSPLSVDTTKEKEGFTFIFKDFVISGAGNLRFEIITPNDILFN